MKTSSKEKPGSTTHPQDQLYLKLNWCPNAKDGILQVNRPWTNAPASFEEEEEEDHKILPSH